MESEEEEQIFPKDNHHQIQKTQQLTLDLSFADNSPYFSVQDNPKILKESPLKVRDEPNDRIKPLAAGSQTMTNNFTIGSRFS